jgi:hypothetical protein
MMRLSTYTFTNTQTRRTFLRKDTKLSEINRISGLNSIFKFQYQD